MQLDPRTGENPARVRAQHNSVAAVQCDCLTSSPNSPSRIGHAADNLASRRTKINNVGPRYQIIVNARIMLVPFRPLSLSVVCPSAC